MGRKTSQPPACERLRTEDGRLVVPHRHGDEGWYDYRPIQPDHLVYLWYLSQDPQDYRRLKQLTQGAAWETLDYSKGKGDWEHCGPWLAYIEGRNPDYPVQILRAAYTETLRRLEAIRADRSEPAQRDLHHWQQHNPVVLEGLVQTMLGGPNHIYHGGLLHCRVFYEDPERRRPGLPPDVAALVDRVTPQGVRVHLVNLHPTQERNVVLRAGAFGEHRFTEVRQGDHAMPVGGDRFQVCLRPGAMGRLEIAMRRYANRPTYGRQDSERRVAP